MKTLLILRHAKSSWKDENTADHDRPLNKRGKASAPQMGELIRKEGLVPDIILSSTARRARRTAELAAEAAGYSGDIRLLGELYAAPPEAYIEALSGLEDGIHRAMVVGHNPGLEDLLQTLTYVVQSLPTAALACIDLPIERWSELTQRTRGKLANIWRPKETE
jgi:phosphohistidine phosphatase